MSPEGLRMIRSGSIVISAVALLLTACEAPMPRGEAMQTEPRRSPESGALFLFDGYRATDDPCRRVGETAATVNLLDDAADLVGCPESSSEDADFAAQFGVTPIAVIDGIRLYSIPRR